MQSMSMQLLSNFKALSSAPALSAAEIKAVNYFASNPIGSNPWAEMKSVSRQLLLGHINSTLLYPRLSVNTKSQ